MHSTAGDVATVAVTAVKTRQTEPSNAKMRQQRGACKNMLGDHARATTDLDAAMQFGMDNALTYMYRGEVEVQLDQFPSALANLDQPVVKRPHLCYYWAFVVQADFKFRLGDPQCAVTDMDSAHEIQPLSYSNQAFCNMSISLQFTAQAMKVAWMQTEISALQMLCIAKHMADSRDDLANALSALDKAIAMQPKMQGVVNSAQL